MRPTLYLDTARLGLMAPPAERLDCDFKRLISEDSASLAVEDFLRHGFAAFVEDHQRRFAKLSAWPGLAGLKDLLRRFVRATADSPVLIAGRSQSLVRVAARCLFQHCHNVLTTDLSWPAYQRLLEDEARRTGHGVTQIALRERLFRRQIRLDQVSDELALAARRFRTDGLFLPAVDNLGIRVPVADTIAAIRQQTRLAFVVTDAAQAIGHIPLSNDVVTSDMVIAGTHKWLGGYLPLGLAFVNNHNCGENIVATCHWMRNNKEVDDPLLDFVSNLESESARHHTETVNLTPLLTCCGALERFNHPEQQVPVTLQRQLANAIDVRNLAEAVGWQPLLAATDQQTGIVLLSSDNPAIQSLPADALRHRMHQAGIAATAYPDGIIRLSMPRTRFTLDEMAHIQAALCAIHESNTFRLRRSTVSVLRQSSLAAVRGRT